MKRAGYTLIEVMAAVVVMTIGAAGILAMQGASAASNQDANESAIAANFANTWLERIKRDARLWTTTGEAARMGTRYLSQAFGAYAVPTQLMLGTQVLESPGADHFGFDTVTDIRFCVNVALTLAHAYNPTLPGTFSLTTDANAVQAAVRVWWYRWGQDANRRAVANGCLAAPLTVAQNRDPQVRKQYYSTIVSWRATGWP